MNNWIDWIGMYGPFLMIGLAVMHLYLRVKYLFWFLVCLILNEHLIVFLKRSIRELRPVELTSDVSRPEYYGMPSGHAQHSFFIMVYLYMVEPSWAILCISAVISCITLMERYIHKRHTIKQLFVGSALGGIYAYICVSSITWWMTGRFENIPHNNV